MKKIRKQAFETNSMGVTGPNWHSGAEAKCTHRFRMYDDGVLYYAGRSSTIDYDPLDDFGEPNAGCTYIEFWNSDTGKWDVL